MGAAGVEESTSGGEGVMRRVRLAGVAAGAVATFLLVVMLGVYLGLLIPRPSPRGRSLPG
jgi:hypothetical protein